jgi:NADH:ubiquinone oxidoreductase subunit K
MYVFTPIHYVNIIYLLTLGLILCSFGLYGFLSTTNNLIRFLISNEIFLLGIIFCFISVSEFYSDMYGQLLAIVILVTAAVETAVVLIIFLVHYKYTDEYLINIFDIISYQDKNGFSNNQSDKFKKKI